MNLALQRAYRAELEAYMAARTACDEATAWHHLERSHILGQLQLGLHMDSHAQMFAYAVHLRQPGEALGQLLRLILAPIGDVTGHLPWGNTGRSHVSVFLTMDIPEDLKPIVAAARRR